jgi:hypothetical protein
MSAESQSIKTQSIFAGSLSPQDITKYTLFRGVTDYTNLIQFDQNLFNNI